MEEKNQESLSRVREHSLEFPQLPVSDEVMGRDVMVKSMAFGQGDLD